MRTSSRQSKTFGSAAQDGRLRLADILPAPEEYSPLARAIAAQCHAIMRMGQQKLTGKQALLLILLYDMDKSVDDAALIMGITRWSAIRMHQRVLGVLKQELEGQGITHSNQLL